MVQTDCSPDSYRSVVNDIGTAVTDGVLAERGEIPSIVEIARDWPFCRMIALTVSSIVLVAGKCLEFRLKGTTETGEHGVPCLQNRDESGKFLLSHHRRFASGIFFLSRTNARLGTWYIPRDCLTI